VFGSPCSFEASRVLQSSVCNDSTKYRPKSLPIVRHTLSRTAALLVGCTYMVLRMPPYVTLQPASSLGHLHHMSPCSALS
jgi:hypothetical protein